MRSLAAVLLTISGLSLAACGSSTPSSSGAQKSASAATNNGNKALAFSQCMRSHGVPNFPDLKNGHLDLQVQQTPNGTTVDGVSVNGPAFQAAQQACQQYLPTGGVATAGASATIRAAALKFSQCMRANGLPNFPDLKVSTANGRVQFQSGAGSGIDPNSPAFQAAQVKCRPLVSKALGRGRP